MSSIGFRLMLPIARMLPGLRSARKSRAGHATRRLTGNADRCRQSWANWQVRLPARCCTPDMTSWCETVPVKPLMRLSEPMRNLQLMWTMRFYMEKRS
jgi:hypothetical protein